MTAQGVVPAGRIASPPLVKLAQVFHRLQMKYRPGCLGSGLTRRLVNQCPGQLVKLCLECAEFFLQLSVLHGLRFRTAGQLVELLFKLFDLEQQLLELSGKITPGVIFVGRHETLQRLVLCRAATGLQHLLQLPQRLAILVRHRGLRNAWRAGTGGAVQQQPTGNQPADHVSALRRSTR